MNYLKKKIKQFACLHLWKKTVLLDIMYGKGFLYQYECKECEKKIARWTGNEPISMITPPNPWEIKRNPYTDMSPPIIRSDD
jgi:hypothetical protein